VKRAGRDWYEHRIEHRGHRETPDETPSARLRPGANIFVSCDSVPGFRFSSGTESGRTAYSKPFSNSQIRALNPPSGPDSIRFPPYVSPLDRNESQFGKGVQEGGTQDPGEGKRLHRLKPVLRGGARTGCRAKARRYI
jgi:hypothetical protein